MRSRTLVLPLAGPAVLILAAIAGLAVWLGSGDGSDASSHREAPLISQDPTADATDLYAFVSPDAPDTVTFVGNFIPLQDPASGPNFFKFGDDVRYEFNIDNNGDAVADVTYRFTFATQVVDPNTFLYNTGPVASFADDTLNVKQTYTVTRVDAAGESEVASGLSVAPYNVGPASMPDYEALAAEAVHELPGGGQVFAGPRDDPFFAALGPIFDLLQVEPAAPDAGYADYLAGKNVHSIVLQVPHTAVTSDGAAATDPAGANAIIGVCLTSHRQSTTVLGADGTRTPQGDFVQVSRLCNPLVNEVVVPLAAKDLFNRSLPADDGQFLPGVQDPIPGRLIPAIYGVDVPPAPRDDLVTIFLTGIPDLNQPAGVTPSEQLRLNLAVPPTDAPDPLGVLAGDNAGFPNGRRLTDDVVDIALRAVAGGTPFTPDFNVAPNNALADGVTANDKALLDTFPYVAFPTPYDELALGAPAAEETPEAEEEETPEAEATEDAEDDDVEVAGEEDDDDDNTGTTVTIVILAVAGVAALAAGGYFFMRGRGGA
jgi:flagellar basal body-associated protein FliL